jgi:outer membrane protein assembly factor BamD
VVLAALLSAPACRRKKYENPITKDTQQPDKVLFDKAIGDIERGRYEIARLTLNTLMNTYVDSEYMAKAKLAIADTWYREGGSHGLAQAEAEYKDFILFYPTLEEAAEAQQKVCRIHYKQMEKPDRDTLHALRAEEECRQLLVQFPNSQYRTEVEQLLRNIQEVVGQHEFVVGDMYHKKGSYAAAANRLQNLTDHYPLFSQADEALWKLGDAYSRMGPRFRDRAGEAYARIAREYPLSSLAEDARRKLKTMELPIPEADQVALARMQYDLENSSKSGLMHHFWGLFRKSPDTTLAAKSGAPVMESLRPSNPASVPAATPGLTMSTDVTVAPITGPSALDTQPDARQKLRSEVKPGEPEQPAQPSPSPPPGKNQKKKKK